MNRRELLQSGVAAAAMLGAGSPARTAPAGAEFSIDAALADFMKAIGGSPDDAGGRIVFTGRDPILRSPFRLGACMAIPAMAGGVGAAAIWRERTGEPQDLSADLRQAIYGIAPWAELLAAYNIAAGALPADWLPKEWTGGRR